MIIQTLVENAVKHGIAELTTPGIIEIRADVVDSSLWIQVRDNGPGFSEPAIRQQTAGEGGHGLRSVRDRLRGHFGAAANFSIGREPARGMTLVSIEIPLAAAAATTTP
jgi:sensor histidine kinase YesM